MLEHIEVFRKKKIRATPQRLGVYKVLCRANKHLTAEQIYGKMKAEFPALSLATVYSILEFLKKSALVQQIRITFDKSCFEARCDQHHHFFCKRCKVIFDIDIPRCSALRKKEVDGFLIEELQGYFYGICRDCKNKVKDGRGD